MSEMKINDWVPENDFKYVIRKHHTARLKKVLTTIFPKNEGWDFSVSKKDSVLLNVNIMKIPVSLEESLNLEKLKWSYFYNGILKDFNGTEEEKNAFVLKTFAKNTSSGGYTTVKSYYVGLMSDVLEIIEDVISFSIAPQRDISEDGDYGNIPNYYKNIIFGKWDKPLKIAVNGKKLNKNDYLNRLDKIKNEVKNLRAFENVMENF